MDTEKICVLKRLDYALKSFLIILGSISEPNWGEAYMII